MVLHAMHHIYINQFLEQQLLLQNTNTKGVETVIIKAAMNELIEQSGE